MSLLRKYQKGDSKLSFPIGPRKSKFILNNKIVDADLLEKENVGDKTVESQLKTFDAYKKSLDYMRDWQNSPKYKEMLMNSSINKDMYNYTSKMRNENLKTVPMLRIATSQEDEDSRTGGSLMPYTGQITIFPYGLGKESAVGHEMSHATDRPVPGKIYNGNWVIPKKDVKYINEHKGKNNTDNQNYKDNPDAFLDPEHYKEHYIDYVGEPTETRARLNEIRKFSKNNNLYDPFKEGVSPELYHEKLKNAEFPDNPMEDLKSLYTDEEIIYMLNHISKNDKKINSNVQASKKGGLLYKP